MKLKDGGDASNEADYEPYVVGSCAANGVESTEVCSITNGQQMNVYNGKITDYTDDEYMFTGLPEGTFAVKFSSGTNKLSRYFASPANQGSDDTADSDGIAVSDETTKLLDHTLIKGISMPARDSLGSNIYTSANNDSGFYARKSVSVEKVWDDDDNSDELRP